MSYRVEFSFKIEKSLQRLKKKDKSLFEQVQKKIIQIILQPEHYKPLRNELAGFRRTHIQSLVLIYCFREQTIRFVTLEHHDKAY